MNQRRDGANDAEARTAIIGVLAALLVLVLQFLVPKVIGDVPDWAQIGAGIAVAIALAAGLAWVLKARSRRSARTIGIVGAVLSIALLAVGVTTGGDERKDLTEPPTSPVDTECRLPSRPPSGPTFIGVVDGRADAEPNAPIGVYPVPNQRDCESVYAAKNDERFVGLCQTRGQRLQNQNVRASNIWTLINTPHGYGYIPEVWFGFHDFELDRCS